MAKATAAVTNLKFQKAVAKYGYFHNKEQKKDTEFEYMKKLNVIPLHKQLTGRGASFRNQYFKNTLLSIGGSEINAVQRYEHVGRFGGGRVDTLVYLKNFDYDPQLQWTPLLQASEMCKLIFDDIASIKLTDVRFAVFEPDVPLDTSPGITYRRLGFRKKGDALPMCRSYLSHFLANITDKPEENPPLVWCLAGRPKMLEVSEAYFKVSQRKSVGRAVWVSDMEEAILSRYFTIGLTKKYTGRPSKHKIMINFDRTRDSKEFYAWAQRFDYFIEADYSKFDSSIRPDLIKYAFDVLKELYSNMTELDQKVYNYLIHNFVHSIIDYGDGRTVQKDTGIPSGSGFTSIIGSICNYVMVHHVMAKIGVKDDEWDARVYGDDLIIGLNRKPEQGPSAFKVRRDFLRSVNEVFQVKIDDRECKLVREKHVKVLVPHYDVETHRGTSKLTPIAYEEFEDDSEMGGLSLTASHRWQYKFTDTFSFLGYSFKKDGTMIRPTIEVLARIYNPEQRVKTWDDHITMLKMALLENFENRHTVNRVYHYLLDAWWVLSHARNQRALPDIPESRALGRTFYRRSDDWVNLPACPEIADFNAYWLDLQRRVFECRHALPFDEKYFMRIRKNRLGHAILESTQRGEFYKKIANSLRLIGLREPTKVRMIGAGLDIISNPELREEFKSFLYHRDEFYALESSSFDKKKIEKFKMYTQNFLKSTFGPVQPKITNLDILEISGLDPFSPPEED